MLAKRRSPQQSGDHDAKYRIVRKRLSSLKPSPENETLYRQVDFSDREIGKLADSIKKIGLSDPLIVTHDGWIVSGHRRYAALQLNSQKYVPCRVLSVRRDSMSADEFLALIREHNRQRYKNVAEQVREEMLDINPEQAHARLRELRDKSVDAVEGNDVETLDIEGTKTRHAISDQKAEHVKYVKQVVFEDRKEYWPLSVRGVHYALLNYQFLRNVPQRIKYKNDGDSYSATSDLITRMRLNGTLPWRAFDDGTRPLTTFRPFDDVRQFVRQQMDKLFCGYWRNLLQSQPHHVELLCEKNTIYHIALRVTKPLHVPTSSARGFNSIDPWHDLYERYMASGKERLIVVVLSDFDPEGEMIP